MPANSANAPEKDAWLTGNLDVPVEDGKWIKGILKYWNKEKGYGFMERDDGLPDVFVHVKAVLRHEESTVYERLGQTCKVIQNLDKEGRPRARRILFLDAPT